MCAPSFCLAESAADALAASLIEATGEQERTALLAAHPEIKIPDLIESLLQQSETLRKAASYAKAIAAAETALSLAAVQGDRAVLGRTLFQVGKVRYYSNDYPNALEPFLESLEIRKQIPDRPGIAQTLTFIGNVYRQQGEYAKALDYFDQSLKAGEEAESAEEIARVHHYVCLAYQEQRKFDDAARECSASLKLRRELGGRESIAESLLAEGRLFELQEKYDDALAAYRESLKLYEELGGYPYFVSYLYTCIGNISFWQSDYAESLEALEKGIQVSEAAGDKPNESALRSIGAIHDVQGNYDLALQYLQKTLNLYKELKIDPLYAIRVQDAIGNVYLHAGKFAEARSWLEQSLQAYQKADTPKDLSYAYNELGDLEFQQKNYRIAGEYYAKGLEVARSGKVKWGEIVSLKDLALVAFAQKQYDSALAYARSSAAMAVEMKQAIELWQALEISGQAYAALGQPERARQALEQSIAVLEDLRGKVAGGEEQRQQFLVSRIEPYQAMIKLLLSQKENAQAFEYAERARARVLLDSLQGTRTDPAQFMTAAERAQEQSILERMAALNLRRIQENQESDVNRGATTLIDADLQQARNDYESFSTKLYAAHPELRLQNRVPSISSQEVSTLIGDGDTAVLEYVVTPEVTHLFVFTPGPPSPEVFSVPVGREDLAKRIEDFRKKIADQDLGFGPAGADLYKLLVLPAESLLRKQRNLLIVPDAELWSLPFAALRSGSGRYLLQDHVVVYVPSLAALREMNRIRNRTAPGQPAKLFAMGNPTLSQESARQLSNLYRGETLGPLPDAEKEVRSLAAIYGPARAHIYVGKEAREDRFKAEAPQYTILHIASHGILNDVSPLYSQLALAPGSTPGTEDGMLEAWEILRMKLQADLAVLSACETARGRAGSGEGMIGLSWALLVAGVPTTVASQWKVESKSTTEAMVEFHRLLASGKATGRFPVAAALRQSALQMLNRPVYRHPFYWAGFVVIGAGS